MDQHETPPSSVAKSAEEVFSDFLKEKKAWVSEGVNNTPENQERLKELDGAIAIMFALTYPNKWELPLSRFQTDYLTTVLDEAVTVENKHGEPLLAQTDKNALLLIAGYINSLNLDEQKVGIENEKRIDRTMDKVLRIAQIEREKSSGAAGVAASVKDVLSETPDKN